MSRGLKQNEGALVAEQRTKATAKYVRSSAYKAREVLDLIRGLDVLRADEVLQFTDRSIARDVRKVLASAVANATDARSGSYIGDADELFVLACFADEGPTLRRFRPRARGRATRIRKRSCHITVVVARMSDQRLEIVRARAEGANASASANRRARVERSRKRAEAAKAGATADVTEDTTEEVTDELDDAEALVDDVDAAEVVEDDTQAAETLVEDEAETAEGSASDEADGGSDRSRAEGEATNRDGSDLPTGSDLDSSANAESEAEASPDHQKAEFAGAVLPDAEGNGPDTHPIKGNADSMLYHTPESRYYKVTKAEVWFDTVESAEAAGFSAPGGGKAAEGSASDEAEPDEANQRADEEGNS